jgi:hypothetical protein
MAMRSLGPPIAVAVAAAALLAAPSQAQGQAGTVSGAFTMAGKALKPAHVAAFRVRNQNAPRTIETYIMLTLKPVDVGAISAEIDPYVAAINDPAAMQADYLSFWVSESGETRVNAHVGGTQYIDSSGIIMGSRGSLVATCKENTPARIACNVKTAAAVKPLDGPSWTLDVTFAAPVSSRTPGKPLPADGGPAAKALLGLIAAVGGNALAPILAGLTPDEAKGYQETWRSPAENLESAKSILSVRLPKKPKVTGGEQVADDHVVLEVEGEPFTGSTMLYLVQMKLVEGRWRYDRSNPVGLLR